MRASPPSPPARAAAVLHAAALALLLARRAARTRLWLGPAAGVPAVLSAWLPVPWTWWAGYDSVGVAPWWVFLEPAGPPPAAGAWLLLTVAPLVALPLLMLDPFAGRMAGVELSDRALQGLGAVAISLATLAAKALTDRLRAKTDTTAALGQMVGQQTQHLFGFASEQMKRMSDHARELQLGWSNRESEWHETNAWCRRHCLTFPDRPAFGPDVAARVPRHPTPLRP